MDAQRDVQHREVGDAVPARVRLTAIRLFLETSSSSTVGTLGRMQTWESSGTRTAPAVLRSILESTRLGTTQACAAPLGADRSSTRKERCSVLRILWFSSGAIT